MCEPQMWSSSAPIWTAAIRPSHILDVEVVVAALLLLDADRLERVGKAGRGVLLEEAVAVGPVGTAHQAERPVGDVRQDAVLGDREVVVDELALGDALPGEERPGRGG